jgi:DNA invertase Pin-like site-specific DNA recombinase
MAGLRIVGIVREEGVSGSVPLSQRPGGQQVLALQKQYKAAHIVALKLDRLFRDAEDALRQTRTWDRAGIALHLVDMGGQSVNTASAMGRMMFTMMAAFAELERNLIAERTTQALKHKKQHRQAYAPTPYGYSRTGSALEAVESEQATVRQIRAWRAEGLTLRKIVCQLNEAGMPTKRGGQWAPQTVKYILDNDLYREGHAA